MSRVSVTRANEHSSSIPRDEVVSAVYSPSKTSEANVVRGKDSRNRELPELLLETAHREGLFFGMTTQQVLEDYAPISVSILSQYLFLANPPFFSPASIECFKACQ